MARLHIYHFKLPAAEALPAVAAGLCGAAHTHALTLADTCTPHNCLDSQTKATHGLSTFQLAPWEPTRGSSSCSSLLLLSSRHFMPIYMNSYIKCVFNITYIYAYVYLADTGLSADICICICAQIIARTCAQRLLLQFYDFSILHIFYVSPAFCCC